jgi:hypothetical protein
MTSSSSWAAMTSATLGVTSAARTGRGRRRASRVAATGYAAWVQASSDADVHISARRNRIDVAA